MVFCLKFKLRTKKSVICFSNKRHILADVSNIEMHVFVSPLTVDGLLQTTC